MAEIIKNAVALIARNGGTVEAGEEAHGQGGIIEGQDPTQYDPKNPLRDAYSQQCAHHVVVQARRGDVRRSLSSRI